ncbi:MAG: dTMP kinase [Erythrobacter sp.]
MQPGKFIAFEGGEGAGKSTQARLLADALTTRGIDCDLTREPGGTAGAEAIRNLLLDPPTDPNGEGWGARAEALLFAAARADHVEKRIRPSISAGKWVLTDRFVDSSRAYQGGAGELGDETILALHDIGSESIRPDLTILIEADPERVITRLAERDGGESDAIGGRDTAYHTAVAAAFRKYAQADPNGFALIDGTGSVEDVHMLILQVIAPLLDS